MAETADRVVVELIAKTDGYTAAVNGAAGATETGMSRIERSAARAEGQIVRSSGAMANAQRNLGRQFADVGAQLSGGQSPFLILAQQAPQVADALADTGGKAAKVASFFAGPWGAALLAAGSVLGVLAEKAFKTGEGVDSLVAKLAKNAESAERAAQADRIFAGTQAGLETRIRDTTKALNDQNASLRTNAQLRNVQVKADLAAAEGQQQAAQQRLLAAQRRVAQLSTPGSSDARLAGARGESQAALAQAQREAREAAASVRQSNINLNQSRLALAGEIARQDATESGRIARLYDDRINAFKRASAIEIASGAQVGRATQERIVALEKEKAAAIEAANARERVTGSRSGGRSGGRGAVRTRALASASPEAMSEADLLRDINKLLAENATQFDRALREGNDYTERQRQLFQRVFGKEGEDYADPFAGVKDYDRERDARLEVAEEVRRKQEDDIYDLANVYERAFTGGTRGFLDEFKREGIRTVALILAQLAAGKSLTAALSGGTGGFGSLLGSIFGRASGGYVGPGQTVRVNENRGGVELLRMGSQGGTVIPLGQTRAERPQTVTQNHTTIRVELSEDLNARIDGRSAQAAVQIVRASAPSIVEAATASTVDRLRRPTL